MSQFLPENFQERKERTEFLKPITSEAGNLSPIERQLWQRFTGTPADITPEFKNWLKQFVLAEVVPEIPVYQLQGFGQFTAQSGYVGAEETTSSATYADLSTSGPTITGLSPGSYILWYGASLQAPTSNAMLASLSVNGSTPTDSDAVESQTDTNVSVSRAQIITFSLASNSVKLQYRVSGGSNGAARYRFLIALKYANA